MMQRDPVQEAFNVVEMAFNMLEAIKQVRTQINYYELNMRIGIHTVILNLYSSLGACDRRGNRN